MTALIVACLLEYQKISTRVSNLADMSYMTKVDKAQGFKKLWIDQCVAKKGMWQ
jgi:hypothetical protein